MASDITVEIDDEVFAKLEIQALAAGITVDDLAREIVLASLHEPNPAVTTP